MPRTDPSKSNPCQPLTRAATGLARLALPLALLMLTGCAELLRRPPPAEPPAAPPAEAPAEAAAPAQPSRPPRRAPTEEEAAEVERLLARAERAIADDHLTYPARGSALALYDRASLLDPDNEAVRRGLERIVERYLELATEASEQGRFASAEAMLDRARLVDPTHPGIDPTQAQARMLAEAERRVIRLDGDELRDQAPAVAGTLRQAGMASRADGCRARITARTDAEGRWIYQQMSDAPGDARIRADLALGSPPRVEVLCVPADAP